MSSVPAVAAAGLCKSFDGNVVLDGINLTVAEGTIFALLGPNGAGKTTMVQILSTLIPADSGQIRVAGHDVVTDPDGVRAAIGVTGQFSAVDDLLTGEENLRLTAAAAAGGGWPSFWTASSWPTPHASRCQRTPGGCAAGWTWR